MTKTKNLINLIILGMTMLFSMPAFATEIDDSVASCLKAWGKHPFGNNPTTRPSQHQLKFSVLEKILPIQELPIRRLWSWLILGSTSWGVND